MSKVRPAAANLVPLSCFTYGVGHEDEGICLLLQIGARRILLDCGLADLKPFQNLSAPPADLVFCSHAHEDHCRGLLELHRRFPQLPIYASEVTAKLLSLHWSGQPEETSSGYRALPWYSPIKLTSNLQIELYPAGHLPGAAAIAITYKTSERNYKVVYTGDFSVSNFQLVEGLSIENFRELSPDVLIIEGSYGTVRHPHRRKQEKQLMERIDRALTAGKNILLPVPAIGLSQEILKLLRSHHQFTGRDFDIWVDESVAAACDVYLELLSQFPLSVQNFAKHQSLFWDERVCPRMRRLSQYFPAISRQSLGLTGDQNKLFPSHTHNVVLVDYKSVLEKYLDDTSWLVLLPEHPQQYIHEGDPQVAPLKNFPRLTIETYLLAEHSDGRNTTQLIHNLRPQHVILVHGRRNYLVELASLEELRNRYQLHSPANGILVELPIGDRFLQPVTPQPVSYEGELNEIGSTFSFCFPDAISNDPRWSKLADTGIIEARWQGEELIIRGVSQRELLNSAHDTRISADLDCCNRCVFYEAQRCWNQTSPLYGFKVIPEGYCPVFEPKDE
ncbi:MBL fold metallo-hydrolase [Myxosarcina sp. GI1(2024)]